MDFIEKRHKYSTFNVYLFCGEPYIFLNYNRFTKKFKKRAREHPVLIYGGGVDMGNKYLATFCQQKCAAR